MSINIGDNNKISHSNIGKNNIDSHNDNSVSTTIITSKKFYEKEGFWPGVLTGVISSLISSAIIWAITKFLEFI